MKKLVHVFCFIGILLVSGQAFGASLEDILTAVGGFLTVDNPIIYGVALLIEVVCRVKKTDKPKGIIHTVAKTASMVATTVQKGADVIGAVAETSDRVIPQRLKNKF